MNMEKIIAYHKFYHKQLLNDCIPFWLNSDLLDKKYGGYITSVDRKGKSYNNDKYCWFQGRGLWTFSALCNHYGKRDEWLKAAEIGKDFLEKYCVDTDGRMFFTLTQDGHPICKRHYFYSESFYIIGMAEYAAVTGDKDVLEKAEKCFKLMLQLYHDPTSDPYKVTDTSTHSVRTIAEPMVILGCSQVLRRCDPTKADYYNGVVREVIGDILKYNFKLEFNCILENVMSDGSLIGNPTGCIIDPGHSVETSWFMLCEALYSNDKVLQRTCLNIIEWSLERGWDKEYGGVVYYTDLNGHIYEQNEHDIKIWWVHCEILIGTLMAYGITGDEKYWNWFEKVHNYVFEHFHDKEYGEWYGYLHRDGTVYHTQKGSMWKGPFHLPRCLMLCDTLLSMLEEGKTITSIL